MVRKGEYLERAVVIPGADVPIEGLYHHGKRRPGLLVVPPHPERGGSMEGPIVAEVAYAATRAGHPTLRFNYRGVGASGGAFDAGEVDATADVAAEHLAACCDPDDPHVALAVVGLGFGAAVAGRLARTRPHVSHLFLVSPEPDALDGLEAFKGTLVVAVGGQDPMDRAPWRALVDRVPDGRMTVIFGADQAFRRGLVQLGRVVAETLHPPGELELV
ncbi:MAG: alpha/beta hydrolase [Deltaproteobacteria bacterium]